jgi:glycerol-3-phosphate dehydrogenase
MSLLAEVDIVVVGAGVVGSAVARELSGTTLSVALVEAKADVGDATSKANTAILHTGFDAKPDTLESTLVARGFRLLSDYAADCGIPVEPTGAVLVAWNEEEREALPGIQRKAELNGYPHCALISADEVYDLVPHLAPGVAGGLTVPDESVTCTWTTTLALATDAVRRGAVLRLSTPVTSVAVDTTSATDGSTGHLLATPRGEIRARWMVNAAGLDADVLDAHLGFDRFTVTPRRGELLVFDKLARAKVPLIVLPVPSSRGKGVLISPTIYGNVMLGPTADDIEDRGATATTEGGFEYLLDKGRMLMPQLLDEEVTASYAGLRAAIDSDDYLIDIDRSRHYVLVGGIRSTGLTASMAIAEHVAALLADAGLDVGRRTDLPPPPQMPNLGEVGGRPYELAETIGHDPQYGRLVCFCERVSAGEIRDAMSSDIPPADVNGLRRRTRAMNGRCQGFYCAARVRELFDLGHDSAETPR